MLGSWQSCLDRLQIVRGEYMEGYNRDTPISADVISDSSSEIKIPNPREEWVQRFMQGDALKLIEEGYTKDDIQEAISSLTDTQMIEYDSVRGTLLKQLKQKEFQEKEARTQNRNSWSKLIGSIALVITAVGGIILAIYRWITLQYGG